MSKLSRYWKRILQQGALAKASGLLLSATTVAWMRTLDYKFWLHDPRVDPAYFGVNQQTYIYVFWHEYIPYQLYLRGNCDICMLVSLNKDGEVLTWAAQYMGFGVVRGSSNSGGSAALRALIRASKTKHLTITPDGPRGPRRRLANGPIYLSSRLQIPIVAVGMGYDRPWRLNSWDRFAVPRPYSRARCIVSPPVQIPKKVSGMDSEYYRRYVETLLTDLTLEAELWAHSRQPRPGQISTQRESRRKRHTGKLTSLGLPSSDHAARPPRRAA